MTTTAGSANPYAPPKAQVSDVAAEGAAPPIWNPNAAASWSLIAVAIGVVIGLARA